MLISPLQKYEPKDWTGLTTENHLGSLFALEPQLVSNLIENIYKVNLGDDLISFMNQFPMEYIDDDRPYEWFLQGADEKNIPLIAAYADFDKNALPAAPGINFSRFVLEFPERYFEATDVLVGNKVDLYKLRIVSDPINAGTDNWLYQVELVTGDSFLSVPSQDLALGTRWSKEYSLVEQTLSKRGGLTHHTSPFRMQNVMSMIRKQYTVPGNMIRKGKNKPMAFSWKDQSGKVQTAWIKKLDYDFMVQCRREIAKLLMFGTSNKKSDGTYGNLGDSGYEIRSGAGLREQIAPSNKFFYNNFNLDYLTETLLGLSVGKLPEDKRRFVLGTGEYGMFQFHKAAEEKASNYTPNFDQGRITHSGKNKMGYKGQFLEYKTVNGITVELMHIPQYDDPVRNKIYHPDGGLAESRRYTIMDFGTADGDANIKQVGMKGDSEIFRYIPGLRDPYSPYDQQSSPTMAASSVDGYEVHKAYIGGIMVKNPMRMAEYIPNILT